MPLLIKIHPAVKSHKLTQQESKTPLFPKIPGNFPAVSPSPEPQPPAEGREDGQHKANTVNGVIFNCRESSSPVPSEQSRDAQSFPRDGDSGEDPLLGRSAKHQTFCTPVSEPRSRSRPEKPSETASSHHPPRSPPNHTRTDFWSPLRASGPPSVPPERGPSPVRRRGWRRPGRGWARGSAAPSAWRPAPAGSACRAGGCPGR